MQLPCKKYVGMGQRIFELCIGAIVPACLVSLRCHLIPTPCLSAFCHGHPYSFVHFWKCFLVLVFVGFLKIHNVISILVSSEVNSAAARKA